MRCSILIIISILIFSCKETELIDHVSKINCLKRTESLQNIDKDEFHGYKPNEYIVGNIPSCYFLYDGDNGIYDGFYRIMYCISCGRSGRHHAITKYAYHLMKTTGWKWKRLSKYSYFVIDFPNEDYKEKFYNELKKHCRFNIDVKTLLWKFDKKNDKIETPVLSTTGFFMIKKCKEVGFINVEIMNL